MYTGDVLGVVLVLAFVPPLRPFCASPLRFSLLSLSSSVPSDLTRCTTACSILVHVGFRRGRLRLQKAGLSLAPLVLALVLGDMAENALRHSLIMSQGTLAIFFNRPIAGVITTVALLFFMMPIINPWWRRLRGLPPAAPAPRET